MVNLASQTPPTVANVEASDNLFWINIDCNVFHLKLVRIRWCRDGNRKLDLLRYYIVTWHEKRSWVQGKCESVRWQLKAWSGPLLVTWHQGKRSWVQWTELAHHPRSHHLECNPSLTLQSFFAVLFLYLASSFGWVQFVYGVNWVNKAFVMSGPNLSSTCSPYLLTSTVFNFLKKVELKLTKLFARAVCTSAVPCRKTCFVTSEY